MKAINPATAQNNKPTPSANDLQLLQEFDLLLEEIETRLQEELIAVHFLRIAPQPQDQTTILELAQQIFSRKKTRTIKEDSILAYTQKRLQQLKKCSIE